MVSSVAIVLVLLLLIDKCILCLLLFTLGRPQDTRARLEC